MIFPITKWLSESSLGVSLWGFFTGGVLAKVEMQPVSKLNQVINTVGDITVILSCLIALCTLLVKAKELWDKFKRKKND